MSITSCRDCENFEERRDIEGVALCAMNIGPYVCCGEFEPKDESTNEDRMYNRFCVECSNLECVNEILVCSKNHAPRVSCDGFTSRYEKLRATRQSNHMKTALLANGAKANPEPLPHYLIEIVRRISW